MKKLGPGPGNLSIEHNENFSSVENSYYRVTEVLTRYNSLQKVDAQILQASCERGTEIHLLCENYAKKLFMPFVDDNLKGYFQSFTEWYDDYVEEVLFQEVRLFDDFFNITGKFDFVLRLKNSSENYLVDLKTSQTPSKTWALQTAAYQYLINIRLGTKIDRRGCLILDKDGKKAKFIEYQNYQRDWNLFESCLRLHHHFK